MEEAKNTEAVEAFIRRWQGREGGQERANYVSFLNELIALLDLPPPDPADATHEHDDYVFERAVRKHKDEGDSHGRIDLYKKNSFVLEAKQSRLKGAKKIAGQNDLFTADVPEDSRGKRGADRAWDVLMLNAKRQAEEYARALSSRIHIVWTLAQGGTLEDRPRYTKSQCFDPFPFPDANNIQKQNVRVIAEELDAHRKRVLAEHPYLTLTGLYNVLEKLQAGTKPNDLDERDRAIFDDGLVLILKELHDRLDAAVADAYGWPAYLSDDEILSRLVTLNKQRSAEEKRGLVRWLRPDYQIPRFAKGVDKQATEEEGAQAAAELVAAVEQKPSFPTGAVEQTAAVFGALAAASLPLDAKGLAVQFKRTKATEKKVGEVLASLLRLGYVTSEDGKTFALRRVA
jgi:hypothetical protein